MEVGQAKPRTDSVLAKIDRANAFLAEAKTAQEIHQVIALAEGATVYAKRMKASRTSVNRAVELGLRAERKLGGVLAVTPKNKGAKPGKTGTKTKPLLDETPTLKEIGIDKKQSSRAQRLASIPEPEFEEKLTKASEGEINPARIHADLAREQKRRRVVRDLESIEAKKTKAAAGVYDVLVIDPPWAMEKIERECRENQTGFDYPTMDEAEIAAISLPCAGDCHVWLWTTHKFLPVALRIIETWGLKYVCTFVWHKPGGFQPFGLPQYNCEFCIYARRGSPSFIDTKKLPTCFEAPRGKHSEKPEEFYATLRRVTAGRRLDMFNRREIDGFDRWGNQADE